MLCDCSRLSCDTQPLWWHSGAFGLDQPPTSVSQKVSVHLGSGIHGWDVLRAPVPSAFWDRHRAVLQSLSSTAQGLLPPCPSKSAAAGWDVVESSIFKSRRKLLPPLPELLDSAPKAFGVAGGYSPTSCWHTPPRTELDFLHPAGEMCLFLSLVPSAVALS